MAWDTTMTTFVRVIIDDLDTPYDYADSRIKTLLIHAAQLVYQEVDFATTYTISTTAETISPDPTLSASKDDDFFNLIVLKAACIMDQGKYRTAIIQSGLKAKAGPASLDTTGYNKGFEDLLKSGFTPCAAYEKARYDKMFGDGNVCKAILSPFVGNDFDPRSIDSYGETMRSRL